jgi:hypothetical protein
MICRRLEAVQAKQSTPRRDAPAAVVRIITNNSTDLSPLTLVGKCRMSACWPDPKKDRHAMSEPTCRGHVI